MKVGILTLRLNKNYGGILQAYALQTILQRLGHEVSVIDVSQSPKSPLSQVWNRVRLSLERIVRRGKGLSANDKQLNRVLLQHTQRFIDSYVNTKRYKRYSDIASTDFEAIVVGSDQVWRPRYFGKKMIAQAYLSFAQGWEIKRISYAASFGVEGWEYTPQQSEMCAKLAQQFDSVSVRELSAVQLCEHHLGIEAEHHLDPTLLLDRADYIALCERASTPPSKGNMLVYVLDETPDKSQVIADVAEQWQLTPFRVNAKMKDRNAPIGERTQPPVEQWIRGFMDAEYVVTDSFHACVFALLFNKPFLVYGNKRRGYARFHSLLSQFGLEGRFVSSSDECRAIQSTSIDWRGVNRKLEQLKINSMEYLTRVVL